MNSDVLATAAPPSPTGPVPGRGPNWLAIGSMALLVLATTWFSITYTRFQTGVSAVWLSNGLLCGALLLAPRAHWRWYFLSAAAGQVVARVLRGDPTPFVVGLLVANLVECAIVAFWVRRREGDLDRARSLPRVSRAALGSTLVACAASGLIALPILAMRTTSPPLLAWLTWYGAHVLGLVIVATLVVCSFQRHVRMIPLGARAQLDYLACLGLLLLTCWVVFRLQVPLLFLAFLPLLLLAWRHGLSGMVMGVVALALTSGVPATRGAGPFSLLFSSDPTVRLLFWQMFIASACVLAYSSAVSLTRRQQLEGSLLRSEARYRLLAENSKDLIVRRLASGERPYVSPASLALTGYTPEDLPPLDVVVHPDDRAPLKDLFAKLFSGELSEGNIRYRVFHRDGHIVWLEALARRVVDAGEAQVVFVARDVSARVQAEQGQAAAQAQLLAITQNLPAMVARFDREARYVYANARSQAMAPSVQLVGKSLPELRGPAHWEEFRPMVEAVLRGEPQEFDTWMNGPDGKRVELHAQFVPDRAADGSIQGFYSLSFDITAAKNFERELERLARVDALTGLANRRRFEEELESAAARAIRTGAPLMVVSLDLDKFKQINDTLGHAVGDEVLVEFGKRIRASVYDVDLVARLGGDEFVVLVQYTATAESGERIARTILAAMEPPMQLSVGPVQAATSIGVGLMQPVTSSAALMALADRALYEAKARGRNTYSLLQEGP